MAEVEKNQNDGIDVGSKFLTNVLPYAMVEAIYGKDTNVNNGLKNSMLENEFRQEKNMCSKNTPADNLLPNTIVARQSDYEINTNNTCYVNQTGSSTASVNGEDITDANCIGLHKCPYCHRCFRSIGPLKLHYGRAHRDSLPPFHIVDLSLVCDICNKNFARKRDYKAHCESHARKNTVNMAKKNSPVEKSHVCDLCDKSFPWITALQQHYHSHKNAETYVCITCKKSFLELEELMQHRLAHTPQQLDKCLKCPNQPTCICKHNICGICKETLNTPNDLQTHYTTHVQTRPFKCNECFMRFSCKSGLNRHAGVHSIERPYTCVVCNKSFRQSWNLKAHSDKHIAEKSFQCEVCQKCFRRKSVLDAHYLTHSSERPYVCEICNKGFTQHGTLQKHYFTHTKERPFQCDICKKSFGDRSTLKNHKLIHSK